MALSFEARHESGLTCGGAYLKYLTADESFAPEALNGETPYTVMFGPDKCGGTNKVHVIFRHKSPVDGTIEEKHLKQPPSMPTDENVHQYVLIVNEDNTYSVRIDNEEKASGSLFEDFEPPFNPPAEIDDPEDKKPEDWVDEAKIEDPKATKPSDWNEDAPAMIPDEDATKPEDWLDDEEPEIEDDEAVIPEEWDVDEDGDWEVPMIPNPACAGVSGCGPWKRPDKPNPEYKGKWYPPMIDNPKYIGEWKPKQIPNPKFYEDKAPMGSIGQIGAVGVEIWTMSGGLVYDNILIDDDFTAIKKYTEKSFEAKSDAVKAAVEAKNEKKQKEEESRREREMKPAFGIETYTSLAHKLPFGQDQALAVLAFFREQPVVYYLCHVFPILAILIFFLVRPSKESKAKAEQQKKAAAKKKDDDVEEDDDRAKDAKPKNDEDGDADGDEDDDKKTPSKRRVRRSS